MAHITPFILSKAFRVAEDSIASHPRKDDITEELKAVAKSMVEFVNRLTGDNKFTDLTEAFKESGLLDAPQSAQHIFGKALLRTLLSYYFTAVKEATHPGETPVGLDEFNKAVDSVGDETGS
jgi:hypothetical protein